MLAVQGTASMRKGDSRSCQYEVVSGSLNMQRGKRGAATIVNGAGGTRRPFDHGRRSTNIAARAWLWRGKATVPAVNDSLTSRKQSKCVYERCRRHGTVLEDNVSALPKLLKSRSYGQTVAGEDNVEQRTSKTAATLLAPREKNLLMFAYSAYHCSW